METIIMVVVLGAALYFLMIRPQQKRAKEQKAKMSALEPGARVMTISGIFGTIRHLGEKQAIIEVAPGVEFTIDKRAISTQPVEDEFEYVDAEADAEPADPEPSDADLAVEESDGLRSTEPEPAGDTLDSTFFDPTPPATQAEDSRQN